jgi:hypothetical protein
VFCLFLCPLGSSFSKSASAKESHLIHEVLCWRGRRQTGARKALPRISGSVARFLLLEEQELVSVGDPQFLRIPNKG